MRRKATVKRKVALKSGAIALIINQIMCRLLDLDCGSLEMFQTLGYEGAQEFIKHCLL